VTLYRRHVLLLRDLRPAAHSPAIDQVLRHQPYEQQNHSQKRKTGPNGKGHHLSQAEMRNTGTGGHRAKTYQHLRIISEKLSGAADI
jgi:hypothetical protein